MRLTETEVCIHAGLDNLNHVSGRRETLARGVDHRHQQDAGRWRHNPFENTVDERRADLAVRRTAAIEYV